MLKSAAKLLAVLGSETAPGQIALGAALGMVAGLTPLLSVHNLLVLLLLLVLRANLPAFVVIWGVGSGLAYLLDPAFHAVGLALLTAGPLQGLWTALYNVPVVRLTRFNNSVLLGSVAVCLALFVPVYAAVVWGVRRYRDRVLARVRTLRIVQVMRASRLFQAVRAAADRMEGP